MIIGITGRAQCGKDTLAKAMRHGAVVPTNRDQCRILHFADTLRDVVEAAFGSRYETAEEKTAVDAWWDERLGSQGDGRGMIFRGTSVTGRLILQKVGTELFREWVHPDFWLFAMERRIAQSQAKHHIIADVRFDNEAEWVRKHGGLVIGLSRQDQADQSVDAHASERGVDWNLINEVHRCDSAAAVETLGAVLARTYLA